MFALRQSHEKSPHLSRSLLGSIGSRHSFRHEPLVVALIASMSHAPHKNLLGTPRVRSPRFSARQYRGILQHIYDQWLMWKRVQVREQTCATLILSLKYQSHCAPTSTIGEPAHRRGFSDNQSQPSSQIKGNMAAELRTSKRENAPAAVILL